MTSAVSRDKQNLKQFINAVNKAYAEAKGAGKIPKQDISIYDKIAVCPPVVYPDGWGSSNGNVPERAIHAHKRWRRKAARAYHRQNGHPVGGYFDFELDWNEIYNWILENIIPILKMLIVIVPFFFI